MSSTENKIKKKVNRFTAFRKMQKNYRGIRVPVFPGPSSEDSQLEEPELFQNVDGVPMETKDVPSDVRSSTSKTLYNHVLSVWKQAKKIMPKRSNAMKHRNIAEKEAVAFNPGQILKYTIDQDDVDKDDFNEKEPLVSSEEYTKKLALAFSTVKVPPVPNENIKSNITVGASSNDCIENVEDTLDDSKEEYPIKRNKKGKKSAKKSSKPKELTDSNRVLTEGFNDSNKQTKNNTSDVLVVKSKSDKATKNITNTLTKSLINWCKEKTLLSVTEAAEIKSLKAVKETGNQFVNYWYVQYILNAASLMDSNDEQCALSFEEFCQTMQIPEFVEPEQITALSKEEKEKFNIAKAKSEEKTDNIIQYTETLLALATQCVGRAKDYVNMFSSRVKANAKKNQIGVGDKTLITEPSKATKKEVNEIMDYWYTKYALNAVSLIDSNSSFDGEQSLLSYEEFSSIMQSTGLDDDEEPNSKDLKNAKNFAQIKSDMEGKKTEEIAPYTVLMLNQATKWLESVEEYANILSSRFPKSVEENEASEN